MYVIFPVFLFPLDSPAEYTYILLIKLGLVSMICLALFIQGSKMVKLVKRMCSRLRYKIKTRRMSRIELKD